MIFLSFFADTSFIMFPAHQHSTLEMVKDALDGFSPLKWWHGKGGLLDYTNPAAVAWWHSHLLLARFAALREFVSCLFFLLPPSILN